MSGAIDLQYPFIRSWIWEHDKDTIWVSSLFIEREERGKGHTSRLIDSLMSKYKKVIVPTPSRLMKDMLARRGFVDGHDDDCNFMIWEAKT